METHPEPGTGKGVPRSLFIFPGGLLHPCGGKPPLALNEQWQEWEGSLALGSSFLSTEDHVRATESQGRTRPVGRSHQPFHGRSQSYPSSLFSWHDILTFLQRKKVKTLVAQSCLTPCDPMDCSPSDFSVHGDSPGKNTGVGCHSLLQGIFLTQWSNPGLLHCRQILYHLSHREAPTLLQWGSKKPSSDTDLSPGRG